LGYEEHIGVSAEAVWTARIRMTRGGTTGTLDPTESGVTPAARVGTPVFNNPKAYG
jgi:hypothetical protein